MDELIFKFLIQSGYPRSSIVTKFTSAVLASGKGVANRAQNGTLNCLIVDPATADYLSVIAVVGAADAQTLNEAGTACKHYARRLDQCKLECFVIRVDFEAHENEGQVRFFRVDDDCQLLPVSVQRFPDIDTLRVSRLLAQKALAPVVEIIDMTTDDDAMERGSLAPRWPVAMYIPGVLLLLAALLNWLVGRLTESALFDSGTINLLIAAAFLLTTPSLLRYYRE